MYGFGVVETFCAYQ